MLHRLSSKVSIDPTIRLRIAKRVVDVIAPTLLALASGAIVINLLSSLPFSRYIGAIIMIVFSVVSHYLSRSNRAHQAVIVIIVGMIFSSAAAMIKNGVYAPGALGVVALSSLVGTVYGLRIGSMVVLSICLLGSGIMLVFTLSPWEFSPLLAPQYYWGVISFWCVFTLVASSVPIGLMDEAIQDYQRQAIELNKAKIEAQDRLKQFEAVFDQTFQLMGLLTPDGTILKANSVALKFVGLTHEEVVGKPFADSPWWFEEDRELVRSAICKARGGETIRFRARHLDLDKRERIFDFSLSPFRDAYGQVIYLIPEGRDITEIELAQMRLRQSQKMESLGLLASGVAHDFNNMLMGITCAAEVLQIRAQQTGDDKSLKNLGIIHQATERAADTVANLLRFARKAPTDRKLMDLTTVIGRSLELRISDLVQVISNRYALG